MIIKTKIKTDKKANPLYALYVIRRDRKMILKALKLETKIDRNLMAAREAIPVLVGYGVLTAEEGIEMSLSILKAINVNEGRSVKEKYGWITTLSAKRIAEKLGGEVIEGGDTE